MYQPRTGRFNAVDPVFNALFDPQKWNRYSYALNRPTSVTDGNGLDPRDREWALGGLLAGPATGRAYGDFGNGGGGRSTFSIAAEQQYENRQTIGFWTGVIDHYVPLDKKYETDVAAVTAINPIMQLATSVTGFEWAKNLYIEPETDLFSLGKAISSGETGTVDLIDVYYDVVDRRGNKVWAGLFHTHPNGNPMLSDRNTSLNRKGGDVEFAQQHGVAVYSAASTAIWAFYPTEWTGGKERKVRVSW